jgi:methyl-accepting chemotaxis protein
MFKNIKIGKKLVISFILIAIISGIGGIVGLNEIIRLNSNYGSALTNYGFSQGSVGLFNSEFANRCSTLKDFILYTDRKSLQTASYKLEKEDKNINLYLAAMQKTMITEKEISCFNQIEGQYAKYIDAEKKVVEAAQQNQTTTAASLLESEVVPQAERVKTGTNELLKLKTSTGNQLASALSSRGTVSSISILILILTSLTASLLTAFALARGISKPVKEIAKAAQRMAEGDLNVKVTVNSKDEIGQLGEAFSKSAATIQAYISDITRIFSEIENGNLTVTPALEYIGDYAVLKKSLQSILTSLNSTLGQINQASDQVLDGSVQVSKGAQSLAQGAAEQAGSVEELSASIRKISRQVNDNAHHAAEAGSVVNQVSSEIEISNNHMNDMVEAMSQIHNSSNEIGKIIKTIEDITFQTNILALNAAVEAARAGATGKGFAVVADEVRNLAEKSAQAAKSTNALIGSSMIQVENGTKIADETAKSLLRVVDNTKTVTNTIEKISQATQQQADFIQRLTLNIDQISNVVQTNSATAEQSAAASEELSGQSQMQKELVQKFRLISQAD